MYIYLGFKLGPNIELAIIHLRRSLHAFPRIGYSFISTQQQKITIIRNI